MSLFVEDIIVYIENLKESTVLLEVITMFSGAIMYKANTQKSIVFLYINNELLETKIKNIMPFTVTPNKIKFLGIHLIQTLNVFL